MDYNLSEKVGREWNGHTHLLMSDNRAFHVCVS